MKVYVIMGVSGCGKSAVAERVAQKMGGIFLEGDDFHPPENKQKMAAGIPLTDQDRWGWLDQLNAELQRQRTESQPLFLACSALRQVYRDRLAAGLDGLTFIYLRGSPEYIRPRLEARPGHFMAPTLLDSQFTTLEEPRDALVVDISAPLEKVVENVIGQITLQRNGDDSENYS